jgi:micrococcal nuclease
MYEYRATLSKIVDGDTYELEVDLGLHVLTRARVRLRGVDTPETYGVKRGTAEWKRGQAAKQFVTQWFAARGSELIIQTFRDETEKYGRWLVEITDPDSGERLTEQLLAAGHARQVDW